MKLNKNVIRWSVLLYIVLVVPVSVFHEFGHALVCSSNGYSYRIWVDFTGGHEICSNTSVTRLLSYNAMGGIFGLAAGISITASSRLFPGNLRLAITSVGLAYVVDQFSKVVLEGFFIRGYLSGRFDVLITIIQVGSWIGFMLYFARTEDAPQIRPSSNV